MLEWVLPKTAPPRLKNRPEIPGGLRFIHFHPDTQSGNKRPVGRAQWPYFIAGLSERIARRGSRLKTHTFWQCNTIYNAKN